MGAFLSLLNHNHNSTSAAAPAQLEPKFFTDFVLPDIRSAV
jgi:hypothetical protein